jgi:hypothetical protein
MGSAQAHAPHEAANSRPLLKRPAMPPHWRLKGQFRGVAEFDAALIELDALAGGNSLPCRLQADPLGKAVVYTVLLASPYEGLCRSIARRFELCFKRNTASQLGIPFEQWGAYCDDLLDYWRDAQTYRSEFVHWLNREQLPYVGEPSHRGTGQEVISCLRIRIDDLEAVTRVKAADKGLWPSVPY